MFVGIRIGDDNHIPSFDSCDPIALIADGFDLNGPVITLCNGRGGLSVLSTRLFVDASTGVGLFPRLRNNSDAIRNVWLEFSEIYLAFGNLDCTGPITVVDLTAKQTQKVI
ncbi:hypothetical protein [Halalkalicoccus tibetensis]|uniref:Uncharacterized protein n=1 Tax=Halalkalicoccus tibetensis TaxID=175632 RepID=A0ABD5V9F1_9EURY